MMNFLNVCRIMGDRFGNRFNQGEYFIRMRWMHPGAWLIGLLITALIITGIVLLIIALVRASRKSKKSGATTATSDQKPPVAPIAPTAGQALQILDERLAKGEIDTDEYRRRKDELLRP
jgi:putative membrane protein